MRTGNEKGSGAADVVIGAAIIIFILLPVFSAAVERYIVTLKEQAIRDAVDLTNISAYNAISTGFLGKCEVVPGEEEVLAIYRHILSKNLNLDETLSGKEDSIAEGTVVIKSMVIYMEELPAICPEGTVLVRPSVHSVITVPIRPSLYRRAILGSLGRENIMLNIHVDSDIPINN